MKTILSRKDKQVEIGPGLPTVIIGERINPTGRKRMAMALQEGNLSLIQEEAVAQVKNGADMLDVNVGAAGVDEVALLPEAVRAVMDVVDVPLCLDSSKPEALQAALKAYHGRALVNSVTGEEASLQRILPVVKEYGAAVVGLCMNEKGIPQEPRERLAIARHILERAIAFGLRPEDIIIDCLAMTVGADQKAAVITLEAMRLVAQELGLNLILGASNVSHGLPDRQAINKAFFAQAIAAGATALIVDPIARGIRRSIRAADLLAGRDEWAMRYLEDYRHYQEA
ncbi:Dihydropteroate synthase-like [Moorella glycerini]|uniref:5-methyltetrahydrofolate:corrinoid/iron-sulfur protein co-methyltransferase n=2 Tax=Neomoorella TaxID=44260 RepID=A0A9X7J483_9FIRM|nr:MULTISPECIES: dihydropteroate synthase [Moorella]PRR74334.1 5-methyltetrahydrofolate:corrinoid/iron-sulfur protein co-methyltransferase [Moorella stamsii]QGP91569.1 5-methyltetrahydrofolate:corrinoid/iron-sulfur protein co-methyltransferase [Moorella glycerini]CEP66741.1 Dihydropteroate synthase-like [Moorella glycerini]